MGEKGGGASSSLYTLYSTGRLLLALSLIPQAKNSKNGSFTLFENYTYLFIIGNHYNLQKLKRKNNIF